MTKVTGASIGGPYCHFDQAKAKLATGADGWLVAGDRSGGTPHRFPARVSGQDAQAKKTKE